MTSWSYDTCILCYGKGKNQKGKICPICHGEGFWEFEADDNHLAVQALLGKTPANDHVREICERRLSQFTPDNYTTILVLLKKGLRGQEEAAFDSVNDAGAARWGWAWTHTNRFAIELCRLNGGHPAEHSYALSRLAWKWLTEEEQKKIDPPYALSRLAWKWLTEEEQKKIDPPIDNQPEV